MSCILKHHKKTLVVKNCLQKWRIDYSLSREELAKLVGSTESTIKAIEEENFIPSVYLALCLATFFDCHVDNIFKLEVNRELRN